MQSTKQLFHSSHSNIATDYAVVSGSDGIFSTWLKCFNYGFKLFVPIINIVLSKLIAIFMLFIIEYNEGLTENIGITKWGRIDLKTKHHLLGV
jgi:hypothetical protein